MREVKHLDRIVYPLDVGYRVYWTENHGNGLRFLELDCVTDDFGCLVSVPRNYAKAVSRDATGWSYRARGACIEHQLAVGLQFMDASSQ